MPPASVVWPANADFTAQCPAAARANNPAARTPLSARKNAGPRISATTVKPKPMAAEVVRSVSDRLPDGVIIGLSLHITLNARIKTTRDGVRRSFGRLTTHGYARLGGATS